MKPREIMSMTEAELVQALKTMKLKEIERQTEKLLSKFGVNSYDVLLAVLIKKLPTFNAPGVDRFAAIQTEIEAHIPTHERSKIEGFDIIQRLAVMFALIISQKFEQIHKG